MTAKTFIGGVIVGGAGALWLAQKLANERVESTLAEIKNDTAENKEKTEDINRALAEHRAAMNKLMALVQDHPVTADQVTKMIEDQTKDKVA